MSETAANAALAAVQNTARRIPAADAETAVNAVFRAMHGFYGQLWLSKFATGQLDASGSDAGVVSAKAVWAHGLRDFDAETVRASLRACLDAHPEFPPSLPQFLALCRARQPREAFRPRLVVSGEYLAERSAAHRQKLRELRERIRAERAAPSGLQALFAAIADACGHAGGDEASELHRLETLVGISHA